MQSDEQACANTDRELWRRVEGDYYSPSIHVTERGAIGINVGGRVIVQSVEDWHESAMQAARTPSADVGDGLVEIVRPLAERATFLEKARETSAPSKGPLGDGFTVSVKLGQLRAIRAALAAQQEGEG